MDYKLTVNSKQFEEIIKALTLLNDINLGKAYELCLHLPIKPNFKIHFFDYLLSNIERIIKNYELKESGSILFELQTIVHDCDKIAIMLTKQQAGIIRDATELLSRIRYGQVWAIAANLPTHPEYYFRLRKEIEMLVKPYLIFHSCFTDIAWDLHQVISHRLVCDNKSKDEEMVEYGIIQTANEKLATIERIN